MHLWWIGAITKPLMWLFLMNMNASPRPWTETEIQDDAVAFVEKVVLEGRQSSHWSEVFDSRQRTHRYMNPNRRSSVFGCGSCHSDLFKGAWQWQRAACPLSWSSCQMKCSAIHTCNDFVDQKGWSGKFLSVCKFIWQLQLLITVKIHILHTNIWSV